MQVILTGATGMVGEGVLHECLLDPSIEKILVLGRRPCGITHGKLSEILHGDFLHLEQIADRLSGYDACYFCLGVSSVGMKEPEYTTLTYTLTLHVATILAQNNPDMVFTYISGARTDSTEKRKSMWARVKGKTENDLLKLSFKAVYCFRPGYMQPTKGLKNTLPLYRALSWMYPLFKLMFRNSVSTLRELGLAMIHVSQKGYPKRILEVSDILVAAGKG